MSAKSIPFYISKPTDELPHGITTSVLESSDAISYHSSLAEYNQTPLVKLSNLARKSGVGNLYVKDESKRFGLNAFKVLGASYAIHTILQKRPDIKIFCTATDGNHGRAVAWSAAKYSKSAVIFVPGHTTATRIEAIRNEGAEVHKLEVDYNDSCIHAWKESNKNGWCYIQDMARVGYERIPALIMAGYQTMFSEIMDSEASELDVIFLQVGVGSFAAAAGWHYLQNFGARRPKIVLVEPEESDGMFQSFLRNTPVQPSGSLKTIMAGLNCGIPSSTAWEILRSVVDVVMVIPDSYPRKAMKLLFKPIGNNQQIISGESGAAGVAGLIALQEKEYLPVADHLEISSSSRILCFNTEGDTDADSYHRIVNDIE